MEGRKVKGRYVIPVLSVVLLAVFLMGGCAGHQFFRNEMTSTESADQGIIDGTEQSTVEETSEQTWEESSSEMTETQLESVEVAVGKEYSITEITTTFDPDEIVASGYYFEGGGFSSFLGTDGQRFYYVCYKTDGNGEDTFYICSAPLSSHGGPVEILCEIESFQFQYFSDMVGGNIYFLDGNVAGSSVTTKLWQCDLQGNLELLWTEKTVYAPIIYGVGDKLVITLFYSDRCELRVYDTVEKTTVNVCSTEVAYSPDERITGDFILYGGGIGDSGFAYGVLHLDNEFVDTASSPDIFYYDIDKGKLEYVTTPERWSQYLYGDERVIFRCEYCYEEPMKNPFVIYDRLTGEEQRIQDSGLNAGSNVVHVEDLGEGEYLAKTPRTFYRINLNQKEITKYTIQLGESISPYAYALDWLGGESDLILIYYDKHAVILPFAQLEGNQ